MEIACLDLEGVLIPEIWIAFAEKTGIEGFNRTTRDEPNYDVLMNYRLNLLREHRLGINEIQSVIATLEPLEGAVGFVDWLRERFQVVILSDTFYEFASPLMKPLGYPTLLCHQLECAEDGSVLNYHLRQANPKRQSIVALKKLVVGFLVGEIGPFSEWYLYLLRPSLGGGCLALSCRAADAHRLL